MTVRRTRPTAYTSIRRRIVLGTALTTVLGMGVLIVLVLLVARDTTDREMDQVLGARIAAARAITTLPGGRISVRDGDDALAGTLTWVADGSGALVEGPRVPSGLRGTVTALAAPGSPVTTEAGRWRLRRAPLRAGSTVGQVVVALDAGPYRSGLGKVTGAAIVLGIAVVAGTAWLARRIVRRALEPVAVMTSSARAWSQDRLEHRFGLGPPRDEITGLGAVLDGLLSRVDSAIRAEQRLTAELAHELRTPLTVIRGEADLGAAGRGVRPADRERFERITVAAEGMGAAMTALLDAARGETGVGARASVAAVLARLADGPGGTVTLEAVPEGLEVSLPPQLFERTVAPLVDNARRYARSAVRIRAERRGDAVALQVRDDGPGLGPLDGDPFDPGVRAGDSPGAGLGLALVRRLARGAGGDATLVSAVPAVFEVVLPVPHGAAAG